MRRAAAGWAVLALLLPASAAAHELLHSVERGKAVAVKVYFADGESLAYAGYALFSPADPKIPYQKGRTDRNGWIAFVPDVPGNWRLQVADEGGHGLDVQVQVGPEAGTAASGSAAATAGFVLRPLLGLVVIGLLFFALFTFHRRKERRP